MKKKLLLAALLITVFVCINVYAVVENFSNKVHIGMTKAELSNVVGEGGWSNNPYNKKTTITREGTIEKWVFECSLNEPFVDNKRAFDTCWAVVYIKNDVVDSIEVGLSQREAMSK